MALTGDGRGRGGPSPPEAFVRRRKKPHAPFAESLIPPKQHTQPQKERASVLI